MIEERNQAAAAPLAAIEDEAARKIAIEILEWLNFDTSLDAINADIYGVQAIISRHLVAAPAENHAALKSELNTIRKRLTDFHENYERPVVVEDLKRLLEICDLLLPGQ